MSQASEKSRKWVFTLNHPTEDEILSLKNWQLCQYITWGEEVGESGTPHLQGFIYFPNCVRFMTIKKVFPRMHLEICRGTIEQAITYCHKDGKIFECGIKPSIDNQRKGMIYSIESALDISSKPISAGDLVLLNELLIDVLIELDHPVHDNYCDHRECESDEDDSPDYIDLTRKRTKY